ncbi:MAG: ROK family protein [Planctomycetota bacterium]|jgi:glucokinase
MGSASDALGFDVGGSAIKAGRVGADGEVRAETRRELNEPPTIEALLDAFESLRDELGATERVGLGVPGLVDPELGGVRHSPNLTWLNDRPLRALAAERLGLPLERVTLENDANAAALGEAWLGGGRGRANQVLLTLGTGIGGGVILNGELWRGAGLAGEIGHLVVDPNGPDCGCGSKGCVEALASATAARRRAIAAGLPAEDPGNLERLSALATEGAGPERELLEDIGRDLGRALGPVVNLLDVRAFVFGGGFSAALPTLVPGIRAGILERSYGDRLSSVELLPAELGPQAGWIGAARVALVAAD